MIAGPKLYCQAPRLDPGGGGVNVARAILKLGGRATAFVAAGGSMGDLLLELLAEENVPVLECRVSGETGYSLAVTDEETQKQYRFSLPGALMNAGEGQMLLDQIARVAPANGLVVLSGGMAAGLADEFGQEVQKVVQRHDSRLIVDTSKAPLQRMIDNPHAPVDVLRLDRSEIETAFGTSLQSIADNLFFAEELVRRGVAKTVVAGHGATGSCMVANGKKFFCHAPKVPELSKIGAGDALVGAFTLSLSRGDPPEKALQWGVAAAAATVSTEGTALCDLAAAEALLERCRLESY
ncbi:PfkB family carbohydrate kinase [Aliiroseovarius sp. PrR006]|uniref:1-phosphofructokinase family hexose kinase n=1 Tax=Aliiroseovarius sp. PrR006 TaxID=2706883 RepID=UPI0013CF9800|nr:1-phosphofructokinase family hexose kinase [Aliiroseovarius sp. PrR006]